MLDRDGVGSQGYFLYRLNVGGDLGSTPNGLCTEPDDILDPEPLPEPVGGEIAVIDEQGASSH